MSVIVARPPNFEMILKAFPNADKPGVIFAFGEDVYNPSGQEIPRALLAHEAVHGQRQLKQFTPDQWWELYVTDPEFRYNEELLAHAAEFKSQDFRGIDRNLRAKILQSTAARLCAPLYNYQPPRSLSQALYDLRWEINKK
jgi:hypothetical protein